MISHVMKIDTRIGMVGLTMTCLILIGACPVVLAGGIPINPCVPPNHFLGGSPVSGTQIHNNGHHPGYRQRGTSGCVPQKIKKTGGPPMLLPIRVMDPGPVRPVVTNAVGLVGALLAAPFRLMETVIPPTLPQNRSTQGTGCPLPQQPSPRNLCGNQIPPAVVAENRYPVLEPQSLLMGVINFPFTLFGQGRFAGDFGESNQ